MIIGNRSETPRTICIRERHYLIPPMGFVTFTDDNSTTEALEALKKVETVKKLMDMGVLVFGEKVNPYAAPAKVKGPQPPAELLAEPQNEKVSRGKPRKTKETMQV